MIDNYARYKEAKEKTGGAKKVQLGDVNASKIEANENSIANANERGTRGRQEEFHGKKPFEVFFATTSKKNVDPSKSTKGVLTMSNQNVVPLELFFMKGKKDKEWNEK